MNDPIASIGTACRQGGQLLAALVCVGFAWTLLADPSAGTSRLLLAAAAVGLVTTFASAVPLREAGALLLLIGLPGAGLEALSEPRFVAALALPGLLILASAALEVVCRTDPRGRAQLPRPALTYAAIGAVLGALGAFPAAGLVALVAGFPIAFDGFQSGWTGASQAIGAVFFFGFFGGFPILGAMGAIAGLLAAGRRPPRRSGGGTLPYLLVYIAGIDLLAALLVSWLGR